MKKAFAILLSLALACQLCACAELDKLKSLELPPLPQVTAQPEKSSPAAEEPAAENTVELAEPAAPEAAAWESPAEPMKNRVTVLFQKTELKNYDPAEGTQLILTFSYVTPHVSIDGCEEAAAAINEYFAMQDETFYTGNDYGDGPSDGYYGLLEQAEDNYTYFRETGSDMPLEYSCERVAEVYRMDDAVIVINLGTMSYTGGAHGFYSNRTCVFDTQTGRLLTLEDLTPDYAALSAYLVQRMVEMTKTDADLNDAIASYLDESEWEQSFAALLREGSWCLTDKGLVVSSDLYEISSYAAGIQSFVFPYDELGEMIDAKWRPGGQAADGVVKLMNAEELPEGVPVLNSIALDEVGTDLCLAVEGRIVDARLNRAVYTEWSGGFYASDPIWYSSFVEDSALEIVTDIPDGFPNLVFSYRTGDGVQHHCLLTQSGEDGHLILMQDDFNFLTA